MLFVFHVLFISDFGLGSLADLCRWVELSDELPLSGTGSFDLELTNLAMSTPSSTSFHLYLYTNCNFIYKDDIVLNATRSPEYFVFSKSKTKAVSDNDTYVTLCVRSVWKPLSLLFILLVALILHCLQTSLSGSLHNLQKYPSGEYIKKAFFSIEITWFSAWLNMIRDFKFCMKLMGTSSTCFLS